jgi:hypothetical protein
MVSSLMAVICNCSHTPTGLKHMPTGTLPLFSLRTNDNDNYIIVGYCTLFVAFWQ